MLKTPFEQLAYIIEKARESDEETAPVDSDPGSNPSDDNDVAILEDTGATRPSRNWRPRSMRWTTSKGSSSSP